MDPQTCILVGIITLAAAFIAWRVWSVLRVARGEKACGGCGCANAEKANV